MRSVISDHVRPHLQCGDQADRHQHGESPSGPLADLARPHLDAALGLECDVIRAVDSQRREGDDAGHDRVPVENPRTTDRQKICPQRFEEHSFGPERNATNDVAQRRAKEHRQRRARSGKREVPKPSPERIVDVSTQLDAKRTQHQQPQHHHQGEVEAAEARRIEHREAEEQRAGRANQPDLVAVPHRTDGAEDAAALRFRLCGHMVNDSRAEIEPVEHDVDRQHQRDGDEPERFHLTSRAVARGRSHATSGTGTASTTPCTCP